MALKFIANNTETKTVQWNFGDGTALSADQSPIHKFTLTTDPQTFTVTLTATDGPCVISKKQEVTLSKPQQQIFSIKPNLFCSNDSEAYTFTADPAIKDIAEIENPNGLKIDRDAAGNFSFKPSNQNLQQKTTYNLACKGAAVDLTILPAFSADFRVAPDTASPLSRRFITGKELDGKKFAWNFGDGSPVSNEATPAHQFKLTDNVQTFLVILTVTDGPCKATSEQNVVIEQPRNDVFTIQPASFCVKDKEKKVFKIDPVPDDVGDIKNANKLIIEKDAENGELFFIPAKQDITQTRQYALNFKGIDLNLTIFVPDAGFIMNITQNVSPVASFPVILNLKAKQRNANRYKWELSNNFGNKLELNDVDVVDFDMAKLADPNKQITPLKILLTVDFNKQTGVICSDDKNYIITADVLGKHRNNGEFDNLTP